MISFVGKMYIKQNGQKKYAVRVFFISLLNKSLPKCNFIEFKDISVDAIDLNLVASVHYQDFRPHYFCSYFLSCPLKLPIHNTHFLKQLISIPE